MEGAMNAPILKFQAEGGEEESIPTEKLERKVGVAKRCPRYPNWNTRADGTCGRSSKCDFHLLKCPASK